MTDIASLSLEIDSSAAVKAREEQDALTASGKKLEDQYDHVTQAQVNANYASYKAAQAFMNQRVAIEGASAEVQKILGRYDPLGAKLRQLQTDFNTLDTAIQGGRTGGTSDAALDKTMKSLNDEINKTKGLMVAAGAGTAEAGMSMASLGLNTQYARRELMTLGREALSGDFTRLPITFGSLISHSNILALLLNPITIGVIALGAGVVALAVAFTKGAAEAREMNNAIQLTSSYAGLTRGALRELASDMSDVGAVTVGVAKEIASALVTSGQISAGAIGTVARLASDFAAATGKKASEIAPELVKLFADPAKGAEELNKQMHFLTPAELEHIGHLERIGDLDEAQLLLAQKLTDQIPKQISQLGGLETALDSAKKAWSAMLDAALSVGRPETPEEALASAQKKLQNRTAAGFGQSGARNEVLVASANLLAVQEAAAYNTSVAAANAEINKASTLARQTSEYAKIRDLQDQITLLDKADVSTATAREDHDRAIAALRKQIRDITSGINADDRALLEQKISVETKAFEVEQKNATERVDSLVKLGVITTQQGDERKLAITLETILEKKKTEGQILAQEGLKDIERARHLAAISALNAEAARAREVFAEQKKLKDAARIEEQSKTDASMLQGSATTGLGNIGSIYAEIEAMKKKQAELGATTLLVAELNTIERNRQIALLEYDASVSQLPEDDPYIVRLRAQIAALTELRDAESQYAVDYSAYQKQQNEISRAGLTDRQRFQQMTMEQQARSVADDFTNNISAAASYNKKAFEIAKVAAIANSLIKGYSSVLNAYEFGSRIGGPYVGAAFAALAAAAVAVQISAIQHQQFEGGGGAVAAIGGGGLVSTPQAVAETRGAPKTPTVVVNLYGNESTKYTKAEIREFFKSMNDSVDDGSRFLLVDHQ